MFSLPQCLFTWAALFVLGGASPCFQRARQVPAGQVPGRMAALIEGWPFLKKKDIIVKRGFTRKGLSARSQISESHQNLAVYFNTLNFPFGPSGAVDKAMASKIASWALAQAQDRTLLPAISFQNQVSPRPPRTMSSPGPFGISLNPSWLPLYLFTWTALFVMRVSCYRLPTS